ncbi:hypothetical protein VNO77_07749 [Canavalia gladiata]|uniref:Uncharacterized protein n=1 Tax=Canavalia gladiata TaxID=3824 RepID=A0AAN9M7W6_CANGL
MDECAEEPLLVASRTPGRCKEQDSPCEPLRQAYKAIVVTNGKAALGTGATHEVRMGSPGRTPHKPCTSQVILTFSRASLNIDRSNMEHQVEMAPVVRSTALQS